MNAGQVLALLLVSVFGLVGIAAMVVLLDTMFGRWVTRARTTAQKMPVRAFGVGAINLIFFTIVAVAAIAIAQGVGDGAGWLAALLILFAVLVLLTLNAFLALGLTASARWVGERAAPNASTLRQIGYGIVLLELAALVPFVGWILVPLLSFLVGYGGLIIALLWRRGGE